MVGGGGRLRGRRPGELVVDRPPLDPRGAAQAAAELHAYCLDTVQDPVETGDTMVRSTMWSLWWD
ncbi:DUF4253 domain-containing protein [Streptomyces sp. NPDC093089]|uniref:DUF4253 domain-containing protein n=1 Tax=Streptomyces sp. NPDC093089 TaxID=3366024 RepID=UPI00380E5F2E